MGLINKRTTTEWIVDLSGLTIQGLVIPLLQSAVLAAGLRALLPSGAGVLALPPAVAFLLPLVVIDYLYYWNHRAFHSAGLWALHRVHHSSSRLDVFATSRNTIWTSFFFVYMWSSGLLLYLLADSKWYLYGVTVSSALDVWRHSGFKVSSANILGRVLVLPGDHEWHHSTDMAGKNFGANLNLWDRLHGTFYRPHVRPVSVGVALPQSLWRDFLWPRRSDIVSALPGGESV